MIYKKYIGLILFIAANLFSFGVLASNSKSNITVAGSTTILPVSEKWAKEFSNKTGVIVNVHGGGSTGGIKATQQGTADIGACSRELTVFEKQNLKQIVIGKDALALIVNKKNPIKNLTLDQIRGIFVGRIKNWKELGGEDKPIQIVNRESGSGTRETFEEVVMQIMLVDKTKKFVPMSLKAVVNNSNAEVKETVKLVPNAVGYVSIGYVDNTVKSLTVGNVEASPKNISSGKYQLVRNLYYLVKNENDKKIKEFIGYILSKEGQLLITQEGFFPVEPLN